MFFQVWLRPPVLARYARSLGVSITYADRFISNQIAAYFRGNDGIFGEKTANRHYFGRTMGGIATDESGIANEKGDA